MNQTRTQRHTPDSCNMFASLEGRVLLTQSPGPFVLDADADAWLGASGASGVAIIIENENSEPVLYEDAFAAGAWEVTDLSNVSSLPELTESAVWTDTATGLLNLAGFDEVGVHLLERDAEGTWSTTNLTDGLSATGIASELQFVESPSGRIDLLGLSETGEVLRYTRAADRSLGDAGWSFENISASQLAPRGETINFSGDLSAFVAPWGGINLVGTDDSGSLHAVWTGTNQDRWFLSDLTAASGGIAPTSGIGAFATSWGGLQISGIDSEGRALATWWSPGTGRWQTADLTANAGGPLLRDAGVVSYATSWGGLNVAGLDLETGEVVQYWWSPGLRANRLAQGLPDRWEFAVLSDVAEGNVPSVERLIGAGAPEGAGSMTVLGANGAGEIVRFGWAPGQRWGGTNLTTTARTIWGATQVLSISPTNGESLVNLTRETSVRFSEPVDRTTITDETLYLIANGERVPGTLRVSSDARSVLFFYDTPLPASTEIRVVVDGSAIMGLDGVALDADGDLEPGGSQNADFSTLPLNQIPGTVVFGYVYDSYRVDAEGNNIPVVGATISVDALPQVSAVTDETGYFELIDVPAPEFFVTIDGATATNAPEGTTYATLGKPFHSVPGQRIQLEMDHEVFDIYLPPMAAGDIVALPADEAMEVGFGAGGLAQLAEILPDVDPALLEAVSVTFPAGSALTESGEAATQATIIPVDPDRLPAPLPGFADPGLVISVQAGTAEGFNRAGGSTNFDVPAPVSFPNTEGLAPGEKSLLWSFDHDAGKWVVIGTGTVSADGLVIESDPGVGILAPGWHFAEQGAETENEPPTEDPDCEEIADVLQEAYEERRGTSAAPLAHQLACLAQVACQNAGDDGWGSGWVKDVLRDIANNSSADRPTISLPSWVPLANSFHALIAGFGDHYVQELLPGFIRNCDRLYDDSDGDGRTDHEEFFEDAVVPCFDQVHDAGELNALSREIAQWSVPRSAAWLRELAIGICSTADSIQEILDQGQHLLDAGAAAFEFAGEVYDSIQDLLDALDRLTDPFEHGLPIPRVDVQLLGLDRIQELGTTLLQGVPIAASIGESFEVSLVDLLSSDEPTRFALSVESEIATVNDQGVVTVHSTRSPYSAWSTPVGVVAQKGDQYAFGVFSIDAPDANGDRIADIVVQEAGLDPRQFQSQTEDTDGDGLPNVRELELGTSPVETDSDNDGVDDFVERAALADALGPGSGAFAVARSVAFAVTSGTGDLVAVGSTTSSGHVDGLVLDSNSDYVLAMADALSGSYGEASFTTQRAGRTTVLPTVELRTAIGPDTDGDGIRDSVENVIGTRLDAADTDGDGIWDLAEIEQGLDPLGGRGFPTGLVASLPLNGEARAIDVQDDTVYVATGTGGLAVVDASQFDNPIVQGQLGLPGTAVDVGVDHTRQLAAVAAETSLQIVDISDPMLPVGQSGVGIPARRVEVYDGVAYAVSGTALRAVDLASGEVLQAITLPGSGEVSGIARERDVLFVMLDSGTLVSVNISKLDEAEVLDQISLSLIDRDADIFVGDGIVWVSGGGLRTVDATDPTNMQLISNRDTLFEASGLALNGSGLGIVVPDGEQSVEIYRTNDPEVTDAFVTRFALSGAARDVAVSRGIAYVAAGGRLEVVNYLPFDALGTAPVVAATSTVADVDPDTEGVQVIEGTRVPLRVDVSDDVQAARVELLVNGEVVASDVNYPFDFAPLVPPLAQNGAEMRIQVRAIDTGGNTGLSDQLVLQAVPDTFAPTLLSTRPQADGVVFEGERSLRLRFSEELDASSLDAVTVLGAGPDGLFETADDVAVPMTITARESGRMIELRGRFEDLGGYAIRIDQANVTDLAGNALGVDSVLVPFVVEEATTFLTGPTVVFAIDVSGSTSDPFDGTPIGDINGDGSSSDILDAQLAGIIALTQELVNLGLGDAVNVSLVAFGDSGVIADMDPTEEGLLTMTTPLADRDADGVRDVIQLVSSITRSFGGAGSGTDFSDALAASYTALTDFGVGVGEGNIVFLSDGDGGGGFDEILADLAALEVNIRAFGVGEGASLFWLEQMDPDATVITSTDQLLNIFLGIE